MGREKLAEDVIDILYQQLQLLAEKSKEDISLDELMSTSSRMDNIAGTILRYYFPLA